MVWVLQLLVTEGGKLVKYLPGFHAFGDTLELLDGREQISRDDLIWLFEAGFRDLMTLKAVSIEAGTSLCMRWTDQLCQQLGLPNPHGLMPEVKRAVHLLEHSDRGGHFPLIPQDVGRFILSCRCDVQTKSIAGLRETRKVRGSGQGILKSTMSPAHLR